MMEAKHLKASAKKEVKCCEKFAREAKLPMKIIDGEHLLGGERVVIYFTSEGRVDFRDLVKRLAKEFQTRIELRQVGSRDEARLISDYESCGQECCCRRYLKVLEPVNMRMAKLQKATLDPSKISGHCGRLKCCLRYEDFTYRELNKRLPKKNTRVKIPKGEGRVIDTQILTQLVVVLDDTGNIEAFALEDIEIIAQGSEDKKDNTKNNNNSSNKPTGRQTNTKSGQKTNHKGKQNNNNKSNDDKNVNQH
jgi:cell fate regulator YaaT (PSP1 superfamily)